MFPFFPALYADSLRGRPSIVVVSFSFAIRRSRGSILVSLEMLVLGLFFSTALVLGACRFCGGVRFLDLMRVVALVSEGLLRSKKSSGLYNLLDVIPITSIRFCS